VSHLSITLYTLQQQLLQKQNHITLHRIERITAADPVPKLEHVGLIKRMLGLVVVIELLLDENLIITILDTLK
jgi:hypothetical protein